MKKGPERKMEDRMTES